MVAPSTSQLATHGFIAGADASQRRSRGRFLRFAFAAADLAGSRCAAGLAAAHPYSSAHPAGTSASACPSLSGEGVTATRQHQS